MRSGFKPARSFPVILIMAVVAAGFPGSGAFAERAVITVLHTNDIHAALKQDKQGEGGLALLAGCLEKLRERSANAITVDCGDRVQKGDMMVHYSKGAVAYEAMERLGYDAYAVGNTDLAYGLDVFLAHKSNTRVPILCANVVNERGEPFTGANHLVKEIGGCRVGLTAVLYKPAADDPLFTRLTAALQFRDPFTTVKEWIAQAGESLDLVIVLSHMGWEEDIKLAGTTGGPAVIIGGHSHTTPQAPFVAPNGTLVVQAGAYCKWLGHLTVSLDKSLRRITSHSWKLIKLSGDNCAADSGMTALLGELEERYAPGMSDVIGTAEGDFDTWLELANLSTAALREAAGSELAFIDRGFVRDVITRGAITREDIHRKSPYTNKLAVFDASGADITAMLAHNIAGPLKGRVDIGGCTCEFRCAESSGPLPISSTLIPDKTYSVAASQYILENAEFFFGHEIQFRTLDIDTTEAQITFIRNSKSISPDDRRTLVTENCPEPDRTIKY